MTRSQPATAVLEADRIDFDELYDELKQLVPFVVARVAKNPSQAEEICQEVFLQLWQQSDRYDPRRGSRKLWATTIAHRRAVDRIRSEQARCDREVLYGLKAIQDSGDYVAETVVTRIDGQSVFRALSGLSHRQREAVVLAFYGGRSYREAARELGTPEGTIKGRIRDSLRTLSVAVGADGDRN